MIKNMIKLAFIITFSTLGAVFMVAITLGLWVARSVGIR